MFNYKPFSLLAACLLAGVTLAACGGGEDEQVDGPAWVIQGRVVDASGAGVGGATVSVALDKTYTASTGADGAYELKTPREYAYPAYLSGIVSKAGYLPKPLLLSYANGLLAASANISTRPTTDADLLFASGLAVTHLGDSNFSGSVNSQFQTPTASGTHWFDKATLSAGQKAKYSRLCVSFHAKGVQSGTNVQDLVSISRNGEAGTYLVQAMPATDASGAYSVVNHCFSLATFAAQDLLQVQINSMQTSPGDYDDFEFIAVTGLLQ